MPVHGTAYELLPVVELILSSVSGPEIAPDIIYPLYLDLFRIRLGSGADSVPVPIEQLNRIGKSMEILLLLIKN